MLTFTVFYAGDRGSCETPVSPVVATHRILEYLGNPYACVVVPSPIEVIASPQIVIRVREEDVPERGSEGFVWDTVEISGEPQEVFALRSVLESPKTFRRQFCHLVLTACGILDERIRQRLIRKCPTRVQLAHWIALAADEGYPLDMILG